MSLDIGPALRAAVVDQQSERLVPLAAQIVDRLDVYRGAPAVFAYRPIPDDAPAVVMIINPDAAISDFDGLTSERPIVIRDILIYGTRGAPGDTEDDTVKVEQIGYLVRQLFHRQKFAVRATGYSVIDVQASGPVPAPADDEKTVGRVVSLTIRLRRIS